MLYYQLISKKKQSMWATPKSLFQKLDLMSKIHITNLQIWSFSWLPLLYMTFHVLLRCIFGEPQCWKTLFSCFRTAEVERMDFEVRKLMFQKCPEMISKHACLGAENMFWGPDNTSGPIPHLLERSRACLRTMNFRHFSIFFHLLA